MAFQRREVFKYVFELNDVGVAPSDIPKVVPVGLLVLVPTAGLRNDRPVEKWSKGFSRAGMWVGSN